MNEVAHLASLSWCPGLSLSLGLRLDLGLRRRPRLRPGLVPFHHSLRSRLCRQWERVLDLNSRFRFPRRFPGFPRLAGLLDGILGDDSVRIVPVDRGVSVLLHHCCVELVYMLLSQSPLTMDQNTVTVITRKGAYSSVHSILSTIAYLGLRFWFS